MEHKRNLMSKLFAILAFVICTAFVVNEYSLVFQLQQEVDYFTTDKQGNIYTVKGDELIKYDKTGKLRYRYSNKQFGKIDYVDASNMLKLLVFYKGFLTVVYLDNTLSENGKYIALDEINRQQSQLVCTSHNNNIWLYDQQNMELVRLNDNLETVQQTGNLNQLLNLNIQPTELLEYNNKVYLNSPNTGVLVFDIYGTYYKTIPIQGVRHFQALGEMVYCVTQEKVTAYNLQTSEISEVSMPLQEYENVRIEKNHLVVQSKDGLGVYSIKI